MWEAHCGVCCPTALLHLAGQRIVRPAKRLSHSQAIGFAVQLRLHDGAVIASPLFNFLYGHPH
jgi:hypothetical protein